MGVSRMDYPDNRQHWEQHTERKLTKQKIKHRKLKRSQQLFHYRCYLRHGNVVLINLSADSEAECSLIGYLESDLLK
jgi:hypothetical protein